MYLFCSLSLSLLAVPLCFVLTSNRKKETYAAIFRCLNKAASRLDISFQPTTVVCDFEQAFISAVDEKVHVSLCLPIRSPILSSPFSSEQLVNTSITGCWFHFCQACYRNIQKLGLMNLYENDIESRQPLRCFMGLALLPIHQIYKGFELLKKKIIRCEYRQQLEMFISYFENEWFHSFHPSTWCVSKKRWRTNNFAEGKLMILILLYERL